MEQQLQGGSISDRLKASRVDYAGALKQNLKESEKQTERQEVGANFTNLNDLLRLRKRVQAQKVSITQYTTQSNSNTANTQAIPENSVTYTHTGSSKPNMIAKVLNIVHNKEISQNEKQDDNLCREMSENNMYEALETDAENWLNKWITCHTILVQSI